MFFKKRNEKPSNAAAAGVADPAPREVSEARALVGENRHFEAIDLLSAANRESRRAPIEFELRDIRHLAGIELLADPPSNPVYPEAAASVPALGTQSLVPEIEPSELTAETLRAAILDSGCLLVRGLMDREKAERMARDIDHAHEVRSRLRSWLETGEVDAEGFYDELAPQAPFQVNERNWIRAGGGVLAVDSPRILFDMLSSFEEAGLRSVIESYLGERPAISAQKCTLRKATPDVTGAWHQDGFFLGGVRALNVWLSLSRCGDIAPSMDVVPRRLEELVEAGTDDSGLDYTVSQAIAEEAAGEVGIVRPIFDPGDALLFDDLFLHQTGSDPSMPNPRYAIESWFFGPSSYPDGYAPIAF